MAKFKLKRKSFGIANALLGVNNFKAASTGVKALANGGTKNLGLGGKIWEASKGVAKVGLTGTAVGAGIVGAKGGSELLSGG